MSPTIKLGFSAPHRLVAMLGIALVLILNVLAVQPDLHEALCEHNKTSTHQGCSGHSHSDNDTDSDACVVTQFAHGHILAAPILLLLLIGLVRIVSIFPERVVLLASVDHQLPLVCGPPLV